MVVMEGGCSGVEAPSSGSQSVPHRAWYDGSGSSQQDIDAYFKGSTNYFSQMQGAYSGMSYHGAAIVFFHRKLIVYLNSILVSNINISVSHSINFQKKRIRVNS